MRNVGACIVLGGVLAAAGCGASHAVRVTVLPRVSQATQPLHLVVRGLSPRERVTIGLRATDARGRAFRSSAAFTADAQGRVVPKDVGSVLLAAMRTPNGDSFDFGAHRSRFTLSVDARGRKVASTTFERVLLARPLVERRLSVARDGFQGGFAAIRGTRRQPAVLELGGSEGGAKGPDELLAEAGLPTLTVGYFHGPGLPDRLVNIPLEYFRQALLWLRRQPEVDPSRIAVAGFSYGTEAALLLGVHYPSLVHAVAALAPSGVVTCGILGAGRVGGCLGSPWTFDGKPVPHTLQFDDPSPTDVPAAVIPAEQIRGPIFLSCGWADLKWTSCPYAHGIVDRLASHHSPFRHVLYAFRLAGHAGAQAPPYWPGAEAYDTAVPQDEQAREALWPHLVAFLRDART